MLGASRPRIRGFHLPDGLAATSRAGTPTVG
jgi:hypothetical protein